MKRTTCILRNVTFLSHCIIMTHWSSRCHKSLKFSKKAQLFSVSAHPIPYQCRVAWEAPELCHLKSHGWLNVMSEVNFTSPCSNTLTTLTNMAGSATSSKFSITKLPRSWEARLNKSGSWLSSLSTCIIISWWFTWHCRWAFYHLHQLFHDELPLEIWSIQKQKSKQFKTKVLLYNYYRLEG